MVPLLLDVHTEQAKLQYVETQANEGTAAPVLQGTILQ